MPARSSILWDSYENMQTAWLLSFYSDKEVNVYLSSTAIRIQEMRSEKNVTYEQYMCLSYFSNPENDVEF